MSPLEGIRVLDLSRLLPGPYCSMILGDMGGDVIKVEQPGTGDHARNAPPFINSTGAVFLLVNRNKRSITLNLKDEKGREIFYRLVEKSDVVLESFRPGVAARLGLDYESVWRVNPRIIYCSLSGYGQDGPYRDLVGHDVNYLAVGGVLGLTGRRGGPPVIPGIPMADMQAALFAALAILGAIMARDRTDRGQFIDLSLLDVVISSLAVPVAAYLAEKKVPTRGDTPLGGGVPYYDVYRTKDRKYISIGALEPHFWVNLCNGLGCPEYVSDQFAGGRRRRKIMNSFRRRFRTKTRDEWFRRLAEADVPCGPVHALDEVFSDLHVQHRKMISDVSHPKLGKLVQLGLPLRFSETPCTLRLPPPMLGEHNEEILRDLGYSAEEVQKLRESGVI